MCLFRSESSGHSDVFSRMFSSDNGNKRHGCIFPLPTKKVVMENMTVQGVDCFLKYLYYGDTSFSELPSSVAYELMRAGEKWRIPHLKRTSYEILFGKPLDDFDCGTALKMYFGSGLSASSTPPSQFTSLKQMALQFFSK